MSKKNHSLLLISHNKSIQAPALLEPQVTATAHYFSVALHEFISTSGADPAAGKGGPKLLSNDGGSRGRAPLRREILNF